MRKLWGNIVYGFTKFVELLYKFIIIVAEFIVDGADYLKNILAPIIIIMFIGVFIFPPLLLFLLTGVGLSIITILIILFVISFLGRAGLMSFYRINYSHIHFLYGYAAYFKDETQGYKNVNYYKAEYDRKQQEKFEEELRREEERRRQRQKAQEDTCRKFFEENFSNYGRGNYQGGYQGGYQGSYRGQGGYNQNPFTSFKTQYEDACDVLGVPHNSDYNTIKSAYRKLAKKYHPDISKENNADEMFKKINNAFDFLSEENVRRYNSL